MALRTIESILSRFSDETIDRMKEMSIDMTNREEIIWAAYKVSQVPLSEEEIEVLKTNLEELRQLIKGIEHYSSTRFYQLVKQRINRTEKSLRMEAERVYQPVQCPGYRAPTFYDSTECGGITRLLIIPDFGV